MRHDILAGLLDAVGRLEKPCKAGKELEERIARTKTASVLDVDLLCLLDYPERKFGGEEWSMFYGHGCAHIKYSTQVITVNFLKHIGLCKPLFARTHSISNTILTSESNQLSLTRSKQEQILIHRLGLRTRSTTVESDCSEPPMSPTWITSVGS